MIVMKRIITTGIVPLTFAVLSSYAGYLDIVPDNATMLDEIFRTGESACDAPTKVYNYLPLTSSTPQTTRMPDDEFAGCLDYKDYLHLLRAIRNSEFILNPIFGVQNCAVDKNCIIDGDCAVRDGT